MTTKRILVTGGRDRTDEHTVVKALDEHWPAHGDTLIIVHGDCPRGADRIASNWCQAMSGHADQQGATIAEERHPADWDRHGKSAGPIRNAEMVNLGADLVLAFPGSGRGTWHTVRLAEQAGIPVRVIHPGGES